MPDSVDHNFDAKRPSLMNNSNPVGQAVPDNELPSGTA